MLYVFHVDAGTMSTFDMNIALESVLCLKQAIERKTKIPASSLVLLVSGGEVLQSDHKVSSYSAGTDTNPIYMFSKPSVKDDSIKQAPHYSVCDLSPIVELSAGAEWRSDIRGCGLELKPAVDLKPAVEACCALPPCLSTVTACAQLAQQFSEYAREYARNCDQLVHDQHLQHQGWAAVVANLEDIFSEFCERSKNFKESFKKHRLRKDTYHEQLSSLNEVLEALGKVPMLAALHGNAEAHRFSAFDVFEEGYNDFDGQYYQISAPLNNSSENREHADFGVHAFKLSQEDVFADQKEWSDTKVEGEQCSGRADMTESDEGVTFKANSYEIKEETTLLHWMLAQGNKTSLQDILDYCQKGLALIDADPLKEREAELCSILEYANTLGLKQIKGIEDRLYGLDQLLFEVKKYEREQNDLSNALIQNRERVSVVSDPSVLPTLCTSHRLQLQSMLKKHEALIDIRRRIAKSKDELSLILKARLEAVLKIENSMSVQDAHQMLSFQCFNRLARYFDIVAQLHQAPALFSRAVYEVTRRRTFSDALLQWASDLSSHLLAIHNEEVMRRQEFNSLFHGHFLSSLFPGTEDLPPTFATQTPAVFDARLPKLTDADFEFVSKIFPDLAEEIRKYNMQPIVDFFKTRIDASTKFDQNEPGLQAMVQAGMDKCFDSETETGEFEKLSRQSTTEKPRTDVSITCVPDTTAVSTITEDNMESHKVSLEKLREFLVSLYRLGKMNVVFIKEELAHLRTEIEDEKKLVASKCIEIVKAWEKQEEDNAIRFREETQRLIVDHELELSDMKKVVSNREEHIQSLKVEHEQLLVENQKDKEAMERQHQGTKDSLEEARCDTKAFQKKLEELEIAKQKDIKDLQDKMHLEYKGEIESLRSRFRLVALTNMDRSPSESSLEKIERTDMIEITSHNAILLQSKENAEVEKEEAVKKAVEQLELTWQQRFDEEIKSLKSKHESEKQVTLNDAVRRIIDEKDRQLEQLRERDTTLQRECHKYRETIQQLTDPETNDYEGLLKAQLATLEDEKTALTQQVEDLRRELDRRTSEEAEKAKEEDTDGRSSPKSKESREERSSKSRLRSHTPWGLLAGTLSLSSCLPGHTVLLLWDPAHHNYTVMQEASIMYFVHSDCLPALDLNIVVKSESERRLYTIATVENKEYCYAKKSGNRYHMPRGSRFYRVRVKPYRSHHAAPPCCEHRHSRAHDLQKSVDTSQSVSAVSEAPKSEPLPVLTSGAEQVGVAVVGATISESEGELPAPSEEQHDSIESRIDWCASRMQQSTISILPCDMECSVGRVLGSEPTLELPTELTVSTQSVLPAAGECPLLESELAEEATP